MINRKGKNILLKEMLQEMLPMIWVSGTSTLHTIVHVFNLHPLPPIY